MVINIENKKGEVHQTPITMFVFIVSYILFVHKKEACNFYYFVARAAFAKLYCHKKRTIPMASHPLVTVNFNDASSKTYKSFLSIVSTPYATTATSKYLF